MNKKNILTGYEKTFLLGDSTCAIKDKESCLEKKVFLL